MKKRRKKPRKPKVIKVGLDFAGLGVPGYCFADWARARKLRYKIKFVSEPKPYACRVLNANAATKPEMLLDDASKQKKKPTGMDVYIATPECKTFSTEGAGQGTDVATGRQYKAAIGYVEMHLPRAVIMENVVAKYRKLVLPKIKKALKKAGYYVKDAVLNTADYGIPQSRRRSYMVAIRKDCRVKKFKWPKKVKKCPAASKFLSAPGLVDGEPGSLPSPAGKRDRARTTVARKHMAYAAAGVNPAKTLVVSDIGASSGRAPSYIEKVPCMTATRLAARDYWMSVRGRKILIPEGFRYQGFRTDEVQTAGCSDREICDLIGNSASKNVMTKVLAKTLECSGLVEEGTL